MAKAGRKTGAMIAAATSLELREVSVFYGANRVLDHVSFFVLPAAGMLYF